jgi:HPt (histidine-containing phosphotransfer) domain-containing protein
LAESFYSNARSELQEVEQALQRGDASSIERAAHTLKGGSGARKMSGLCAQLEDVGASGDL